MVGLDGSVLDVSDVPRNLFLTGGRAWRQARRGLLDPVPLGGLPGPDALPALDELAELLVQPDPRVAELRRWGAREGFAVPSTVTSYSPVHEQPIEVDVHRVATRR